MQALQVDTDQARAVLRKLKARAKFRKVCLLEAWQLLWNKVVQHSGMMWYIPDYIFAEGSDGARVQVLVDVLHAFIIVS
jgi:hypothetical protein